MPPSYPTSWWYIVLYIVNNSYSGGIVLGKKSRIDLLLIEHAFAESIKKAQALVMAGVVFVNGHRAPKPSTLVEGGSSIEVRGKLEYVSRGGIKLAHALLQFGILGTDKVALDVGASTGGFTDCLIQRAVRHVYALDVGKGQIAYSIRQNPKVTVIEKVNARYPFSLPEQIDLATIDVAFISLTNILKSVSTHLKADGQILCLVKPHFEAKREEVGRGGIIKDSSLHATILGRIITWCTKNQFRVKNLTTSPITGEAGNKEFFLLLRAA